MGDQDIADRILGYMNEDYPVVIEGGVAHRPKASLWAHALEFTAIAGGHNALKTATNCVAESGPVISKVSYPDVVLASAKSSAGCLHAVMYPGNEAGKKTLTVSGLLPGKSYWLNNDSARQVVADTDGNVDIGVLVDGRTELNLQPAGA